MTAAIEVIVFDRSRRVATAAAETPEDALYAGRVLFDESSPTVMGAARLQVGFYVDGKLVRLVTGRP